LEEAAFRELKEETGYTAQRVLPGFEAVVSYGCPWFSTENAKVLAVEIEAGHESNQSLEQNLDEGEIIEVVLLKDLQDGQLVKKLSHILGDDLALSGGVAQVINGFQVACVLGLNKI
jgi:8-oxo-dGTP pyrophosphatase MutT (NUDIX family)